MIRSPLRKKEAFERLLEGWVLTPAQLKARLDAVWTASEKEQDSYALVPKDRVRFR